MRISDNQIFPLFIFVGDQPYLRAITGSTASEMATYTHIYSDGIRYQNQIFVSIIFLYEDIQQRESF